MTVDLSTKAMLVNLSISVWSARRYDKKVTGEVAQNYHTSERAGRYNKSLLPIDAPSYKAVIQAANSARTEHYKQTLPWSDEGSRILPSLNYLEYTASIRQLRSTFDRAVDEFVDDYPTLQSQAQTALNGLYDAKDYPIASAIESYFNFSTKVLPFPDSEDFRVDITADDVELIRQQITDDVQASVSSAMADLYRRLYDHVSKMASKLTEQDPIFRDSLVQNLTDLCAIVPRLNLTSDPALETLRQRVETELTSFEPETLRTSAKLRTHVAKQAEQIQKDLSAFMVR